MHDIDKVKFGSFVAGLRKEQGMTQKDLAEKLCVSNKAVSKWETGVSLPDVGLLVPLAETLEVTVTELLTGERQLQPMPAEQVEDLVKKAIVYGEETPRRNREELRRNAWVYFLCLAVAAAEMAAIYLLKCPVDYEYLMLTVGFGVGFGWYFLFGARVRLPEYYDTNRINGMVDGPFRMNIPGIRFTNRNWPYILRCGGIWAMASLVGYPALTMIMTSLAATFWSAAEEPILLVLLLGGLFLPIYIVGRKYE